MSISSKPSFLSLLSLATEQERRLLVGRLAALGYDDVNLSGARLLRVLGKEAKIVKELAAATGTTKQFAAREVRRLADAGYVELLTTADDRRAVLVRATARGRRLMAASDREKSRLDQALGDRLGRRDVRELRRLLQELVASGDGSAGRRI